MASPTRSGGNRLARGSRAALYGLADVATLRRGIRRSINGDMIKIPPRWARYYPSTYQPDTHAFIQANCLPGTSAIDVGAHIGVFSVVMARAVGPTGRVLSFEPTPDTRLALERVVTCNGMDSVVEISPNAVAAAAAVQQMHAIPTPASSANSLVVQAGTTELIKVNAVSIDAVVGDRDQVSCVKIDAEGSEIEVLQGARDTIARWRPAIALDVHPRNLFLAGHSLSGLKDLIISLGYRIPDFSRLHTENRPPHDGPFDVHLQSE